MRTTIDPYTCTPIDLPIRSITTGASDPMRPVAMPDVDHYVMRKQEEMRRPSCFTYIQYLGLYNPVALLSVLVTLVLLTIMSAIKLFRAHQHANKIVIAKSEYRRFLQEKANRLRVSRIPAEIHPSYSTGELIARLLIDGEKRILLIPIDRVKYFWMQVGEESYLTAPECSYDDNGEWNPGNWFILYAPVEHTFCLN